MEKQTMLTPGISSVGEVGRQPSHLPNQFQSRQQLEPYCSPRPVVEVCTARLAAATAVQEATSSFGFRVLST